MHEHDKTFFNESLSKKNETMDRMRAKLKRYEFCVKEAILFLGKPIVSYNEWLNSPDSDKGIQFPSMPGVEKQALQEPPAELKTQAKKIAAANGHERRSSSTPQMMAEKQLLLANAVNLSANLPQTIANKSASNLEIQCLECIRLALNYLVNAQNAIQGKTETKVMDTEKLDARLNPESDIEKFDSLMTKLSNQSRQSHARSASVSSAPVADIHHSSPLGQTDPTLSRSSTVHTPSSRLRELRESDDDDGDLAIKNTRRREASSPSKGCTMCRERMLQVDRVQEQLKERELKYNALQEELGKERETKDRILLSKDILEQELEELTEQLFDQANNMVIEEARAREELENKNHDLKAEVKTLMKRIEGREDEIKEMKKIVSALKTAKARSASITSITSNTSTGSGSLAGVPKGIFTFESLTGNTSGNHFIDGLIYGEFLDFVRVSMQSNAQPIAQANALILSTNFMKRCILEDIEPCLYYCYNFSGSSKAISSGGMSSSLKKRFLDALTRGLCEFASFKEDTETEKNSSTLTAQKTKCSTCTVIRECQFKVKLGEKGKEEELAICRACRDRVSSCIDFFAYSNYLRQNKHNLSILSIFRCFMWLRRRIAAARIASCSLFETDFASIASSYAINVDWEQQVHIQN